MKGGFLSLQTSLTSLNFPQEHPPLHSEKLFRFVWRGYSWGKFLSVWEVRNRLKVRLRARFVGAGVKEKKRAGITDSRPFFVKL